MACPAGGRGRGKVRGMIRYALRCANAHDFDSWFQSAEAYDRLAGAGMVACAVCGSAEVAKALMAPSVKPAEAAGLRPLATPTTELERKLAELRAHVEKTADYVGPDFARVAREMHAGEVPDRPIWGEAKAEEAKRLIEDGVPVAPLPFRPTRKAN